MKRKSRSDEYLEAVLNFGDDRTTAGFTLTGKFKMYLDTEPNNHYLRIELNPKEYPPQFYDYFAKRTTMKLSNAEFYISNDGTDIAFAEFTGNGSNPKKAKALPHSKG